MYPWGEKATHVFFAVPGSLKSLGRQSPSHSPPHLLSCHPVLWRGRVKIGVHFHRRRASTFQRAYQSACRVVIIRRLAPSSVGRASLDPPSSKNALIMIPNLSDIVAAVAHLGLRGGRGGWLRYVCVARAIAFFLVKNDAYLRFRLVWLKCKERSSRRSSQRRASHHKATQGPTDSYNRNDCQIDSKLWETDRLPSLRARALKQLTDPPPWLVPSGLCLFPRPSFGCAFCLLSYPISTRIKSQSFASHKQRVETRELPSYTCCAPVATRPQKPQRRSM